MANEQERLTGAEEQERRRDEKLVRDFMGFAKHLAQARYRKVIGLRFRSQNYDEVESDAILGLWEGILEVDANSEDFKKKLARKIDSTMKDEYRNRQVLSRRHFDALKNDPECKNYRDKDKMGTRNFLPVCFVSVTDREGRIQNETAGSLHSPEFGIENILQDLPEDEAEILRLKCIEWLTSEEIGERLGFGKDKARMLIRSATSTVERRFDSETLFEVLAPVPSENRCISQHVKKKPERIRSNSCKGPKA